MFQKSILSIPKWGSQAIVKGGTVPRSDGTASGHPLKDLNHFLDCPASGLLRRASFRSAFIFKLMFRPCCVASLLVLRGVILRPHPLKKLW